MHAAVAVGGTDFKSDPPLPHQRPVGVPDTVSGLVDVRRSRGHTVQLDDFEVSSPSEVFYRGGPDIVDGLLMVDLRKTDPRLLKRFMGEEGVKRFTAVHGPLAGPTDSADRHHPKRTGQEAA